jgi:hypothetical protein
MELFRLKAGLQAQSLTCLAGVIECPLQNNRAVSDVAARHPVQRNCIVQKHITNEENEPRAGRPCHIL